MTIAFTLKSGRSTGEYLRECNPEYHAKVKAARDEIEKAKGKES